MRLLPLCLAPVAIATATITAATPAVAQSSQFALESRVERFPAAKLSLSNCLATARRASIAAGYTPANTQNFPGKLVIYAAGPRAGAGSLTVYCIAVDAKTVSVVQAMDYMRPQSPAAKRVADAVNGALVAAGR